MILDPATMRGNAVAGFTSVRGRSHTFDARADGYARGEAIDASRAGLDGQGGCGHLQMAGSAIRQDGRSASLTAPNGQAQQGVLGASLADARAEASEVAHWRRTARAPRWATQSRRAPWRRSSWRVVAAWESRCALAA